MSKVSMMILADESVKVLTLFCLLQGWYLKFGSSFTKSTYIYHFPHLLFPKANSSYNQKTTSWRFPKHWTFNGFGSPRSKTQADQYPSLPCCTICCCCHIVSYASSHQRDDEEAAAEVLPPDHGLIHCHCDQGVLRRCSDIIVIFDYTYFVTVTNQVFSTHHSSPIQSANNDADCGVCFPSRIINWQAQVQIPNQVPCPRRIPSNQNWGIWNAQTLRGPEV